MVVRSKRNLCIYQSITHWINYFSLSESFRLSIVSVCSVNSNMATSTSPCELFKDGVRAVLHSWPVLQVNTFTNVHLAER